MDGYVPDDQPVKTANRRYTGLYLLGIIAFVILSTALESEVGIPSATTLRIGCATICLAFIYTLRSDFPGERWPMISLWAALLVNIRIFFTPLVDGPLSRGELVVFAVPDTVVVLVARIATYPLADVHQRANRQTMILGLIVAVAFSALLFTLTFIGSRGER